MKFWAVAELDAARGERETSATETRRRATLLRGDSGKAKGCSDANCRDVSGFAGSILPAQNFLKISFGFLGFILSPGLQRLGLFLKRFSGIIIAGLK